jgi:hypothetical protein
MALVELIRDVVPCAQTDIEREQNIFLKTSENPHNKKPGVLKAGRALLFINQTKD